MVIIFWLPLLTDCINFAISSNFSVNRINHLLLHFVVNVAVTYNHIDTRFQSRVLAEGYIDRDVEDLIDVLAILNS